MWSDVESDNFAFNGSCIFICLLKKMSNLSKINGRSIISLKERKGIRNFQKQSLQQQKGLENSSKYFLLTKNYCPPKKSYTI